MPVTTYIVEVDLGNGHKIRRRITDDPKGFEKWRDEQERQGNRIRIIGKRRRS